MTLNGPSAKARWPLTDPAAMKGEVCRLLGEGPAGVALRSSTRQTLALALHELMTNALKHGALAQPPGRLAVTWRVGNSDKVSRPWLYVDWCGSGVTMPARLPRAGGSGRELIERALPYQLGARTIYGVTRDGVQCTIALPISERQAVRENLDA